MEYNSNKAKNIAKQMLLDGVGRCEIMKKTRLRLKDVKEIEREISKSF